MRSHSDEVPTYPYRPRNAMKGRLANRTPNSSFGPERNRKELLDRLPLSAFPDGSRKGDTNHMILSVLPIFVLSIFYYLVNTYYMPGLMLGACEALSTGAQEILIFFLPLRCLNLFNPHNNPVRQAGWILPPFIMETMKLRPKDVCPSDDKNSVAQQAYRHKSSDPNTSALSITPQLPLKLSETWNKQAGRLLGSPGTVALAMSRPLATIPKKRPLGDCRKILPQFQCIRKKVSDSSGCPSAITLLWRLWREYWEQRREARTKNIRFILIVFIPKPSFPLPSTSLLHSPRVCFMLSDPFWKTCCGLSSCISPVCAISQSPVSKRGLDIHTERYESQPRF